MIGTSHITLSDKAVDWIMEAYEILLGNVMKNCLKLTRDGVSVFCHNL